MTIDAICACLHGRNRLHSADGCASTGCPCRAFCDADYRCAVCNAEGPLSGAEPVPGLDVRACPMCLVAPVRVIPIGA